VFGGKVGCECADRNEQSLQQRDTIECINALVLIELLNGPDAPSFVAGTDNLSSSPATTGAVIEPWR
jgi:hypothetical protein